MAPLPQKPPCVVADSNELRHRFRSEWENGARPSIASYLRQGIEEERESLLVALVETDWAFREAAGETPRLQDYLNQFPDAGELLRVQLLRLEEQAQKVALSAADSVSESLFESTITPPGAAAPNSQFAPTATVMPGNLNRQFGRYQLQSLLGQGGFGQVWQAFDPELARLVAIKILRTESAADLNGLLAEARKIAKFHHPGILRVLDVGREAGQVYVVSELMPGGSLASHVGEYAGKPWQAAALVGRVAEALHYAHLRDIVHRDIKPQNILLDHDGNPQLADFGLAVTEEEQLAELASKLGTVAYMSPEQARGQSHHSDSRSDVYSLGVVLYELLTQRLPFVARTANQWLEQILNREPRSPRTINDAIPPELERICLKCLAKKPSDRYTTARDVADELTRAAARANRGERSRMQLVASLAGTLLVVLLLALAVSRFVGPRDDRVPSPLDSSRLPPPSDSHRVAMPPAPTPAPAANLILDPFRVATAEFDEVLPQLNEWTPALRRMPKILCWPKNRQGCSFDFAEADESLSVMCNGLGLIELGHTERPALQIQTRLSQAGWEGGLGIFFGYREDPQRGPAFRRFQAVTLDRQTERGRPMLCVQRHFYVLDETGPLVFQEHVPLTESKPLPDRAVLLEVSVAADLVTVQFGSQATEPTPDGVLTDLKPLDYQGKFGLCVLRGSAVFSHVRVRIPQ